MFDHLRFKVFKVVQYNIQNKEEITRCYINSYCSLDNRRLIGVIQGLSIILTSSLKLFIIFKK